MYSLVIYFLEMSTTDGDFFNFVGENAGFMGFIKKEPSIRSTKKVMLLT